MFAAAKDQPKTRPHYEFSPVNQYGLQLTAGYWNPIIAYVSRTSGVDLTLKIGRTSADTTSYVLAQEVDFAFTNHLFSPSRLRMGWKVLARRDSPPVRSQIAVMEDSPVHDLAQLRDQEVGFPGPEAFLAYKVSRAHLINSGVPVRVVFGGNMDSALAQMASGKVAAVGGNSQLLAGYSARENRSLRVLWSSEPYLDLPLMVSPRVPPEHVRAVRAAFVGMMASPEGRLVLQRASSTAGLPRTTGFVAAENRDYDNYLRFSETAPESLR
ncbi:phosphate/phosphite/phosphonate ABC transporter substrate-binding protein [Xylophilus rhododendri]|uniref:phosphate/phosphite/phosphonate ABC transporter substrate-binding protein n=1 Tax=Xylophilus rhododendri TaxID=2697032 RepID=UPI001E4DD4C9|nr:phosphate/phosphite/phosphonate ABC transporter substrate-binding protein [Xylophilus rhododendri]